MYLPKNKKPKDDLMPFRVRNAKERLILAVTMLATMGFIAFLSKLQGRQRRNDIDTARMAPGSRVVVIGGGAAGAALAASLCDSSPDTHVTVIEKDLKQTFYALTPFAHVGNRSYDLTSMLGIDFLRAPATWNVSRDAQLVSGEAVRVVPDENRVLVRLRDPQSVSPAAAESTAPSGSQVSSASSDPSRKISLWQRLNPFTGRTRSTDDNVMINADGSTTNKEGLRSYPYDVLVVACGAPRSFKSVSRFFSDPSKEMDCHRIAVNPGTTRDNLVHLYRGNVLHLRVPPLSFQQQMDHVRQTLLPPAVELTESDVIRANGDAMMAAAEEDASSATGRLLGEVVTYNNVKLDRTSLKADTVSARAIAAAPFMHCATRQHDGTFVSTANTIWEYLNHFSKFGSCRLYAVTADTEPIEHGPVALNAQIRALWRRRQLSSTHGSPPTMQFQFLSHSYLTELDKEKCVATLYNYVHNVLVKIPYNLLVLDLPLQAPDFIARSGLHRAAGSSGKKNDVGRQLLHREAFLRSLSEWFGSLGDDLKGGKHQEKKTLPYCWREEDRFMDVYPDTLQHRRYPNVFALGDAAGLPTIKSYGSAYVQVPVVSHNVKQQLQNAVSMKHMREARDAYDTSLAAYQAAVRSQQILPRWWRWMTRAPANSNEAVQVLPPEPPSQQSWYTPREANAVYDGYTSFNIVMSTWRSMWPEMRYNTTQQEVLAALKAERGQGQDQSQGAGFASYEKLEAALHTQTLTHCDHHVWDNLSWRGARGFLNGALCQLSLYELLHFFAFNRGIWYPPAWFSVPVYSVTDGTLDTMQSNWYRV